MNRAHRRAEAAKARAAQVRHAAVADVMQFIAELGDPSISGATLFLPTGEVLHVSADAATTTTPGKEGVH